MICDAVDGVLNHWALPLLEGEVTPLLLVLSELGGLRSVGDAAVDLGRLRRAGILSGVPFRGLAIGWMGWRTGLMETAVIGTRGVDAAT